MRLDSRAKLPSGLEEYLEYNGWHFSKKMCEYACSKMYRLDNNVKTPILPYTKEQVDQLLRRFGLTVNNNKGYDYVFVANMCRADYLGSSIVDEQHLARFIKDYIDDPDGYDGLPFTRYYADCIGSGTPIMWEDMI